MDELTEAEAYLTKVGLIDKPGAVLYASIETLKPGPVYLLGLNPGGSEGATLADNIAKARKGNNSYLDEEWAPGGRVRPKGQATLQIRVQGLCAAMSVDVRKTPASNLAFTRSTGVGTHTNYDGALKLCLPVHEMFISRIEPNFLMTFGDIKHFEKAVSIVSRESRDAQHGGWQAHRGVAHVFGRKIAFGNVPHMSFWASNLRPEVVEWAVAASK